MKQILPYFRSTAGAGSAVALALVANLAISPIAFAKGKPGGDEPTDPVTINPVPPLELAPPVTYTATEIFWYGDDDGDGVLDVNEAGWRGVTFNGINNQGLVAGFVGLPPRDDSGYSWALGTINLDPATGAVIDEMIDLNVIFSAAMVAVNGERTDGPWRIGFGRSITDGGLIALQLVPEDAPWHIQDSGIPCLLAVGDITRRSSSDGIMVVPVNTDGDNDHLQLTAGGSALVLERQPDGIIFSRVFPLAQNANGEVGYFPEYEMPVPAVAYNSYPGIKDSEAGGFFPEFIYLRGIWLDSKTWVNQAVRYTYTCNFDQNGDRVNENIEETILHERDSLINQGFGTAGTSYANSVEKGETTGRGINAQTTSWWTPYHILSPTERTPLAKPGESARVQLRNWGISDASLPREEEVVIELEADGELQVYKPNFGARFTLPIEPGTQRLVEISSPINPFGVTSEYILDAGDYSAGYVGYGTDAEPDRVIVLTPVGAPVPGQ